MLEMDEIKSENHFKHQSLKKKRERERDKQIKQH